MRIVLDEVLQGKNLSYGQAALLTGVPKSTIYKIAKNKTDPRLSVLDKIARGLEVSLRDIIAED